MRLCSSPAWMRLSRNTTRVKRPLWCHLPPPSGRKAVHPAASIIAGNIELLISAACSGVVARLCSWVGSVALQSRLSNIGRRVVRCFLMYATGCFTFVPPWLCVPLRSDVRPSKDANLTLNANSVRVMAAFVRVLGRAIIGYISKAWAALVRVVRVKREVIYNRIYRVFYFLSRITFLYTRTTRTDRELLRPFQGLRERPSTRTTRTLLGRTDIAALVVGGRALGACLRAVGGVRSSA